MTARKKQESALGKGLDALITKDYLEDEIEAQKTQRQKKNESRTKVITESKTIHIQDEDVNERIIEEVILEVHKNPRISLWSAKSSAVLRYLKKTKPEFSISKEASHLIEAAVKDKHPDVWNMFEERGL